MKGSAGPRKYGRKSKDYEHNRETTRTLQETQILQIPQILQVRAESERCCDGSAGLYTCCAEREMSDESIRMADITHFSCRRELRPMTQKNAARDGTSGGVEECR